MAETVILTGPDGTDYPFPGVEKVSLRKSGGGRAEFGGGGSGAGKFAELVSRDITTITAQDLAGVSLIGAYAFAYCGLLTTLELPGGLDEIGIGAFVGCSALTSLVIPTLLDPTYFGYWSVQEMFLGCPALAHLELPDNLMIFNRTFNAFNVGLRTLIIRSAVPPEVEQDDLDSQGKSSSIFSIPSACDILVPPSAVNAYQTDQYWSLKAAQIRAYQT